MFDLSITEIIVIAIVAVLLLGPEQMPKVLYTLGKWIRQLSYTRFALERQFDGFMTREEAKINTNTATKTIETVEAKEKDADSGTS